MKDYIKEAKKEFDRLFTFGFAGDSGAGGNDPQEAVYELTETDPRAIWDWHTASIKQVLEALVDRERGFIDTAHVNAFNTDGERQTFLDAKEETVSYLKEQISKLDKQHDL